MEWAVYTASSDSEDATTQEINEEEGALSNRDQQDTLNGAREQSSKDAQGFVDLTSVKEAASTRNGWVSMDAVKAEVGKKPSNNGGQDLIHFEKKQGIKLSAPYSLGSTFIVNIPEGAGIPDRESENITMQMMREDEEQVLVTQEDHGESTEELEFDSSTFMNGVSQKLNQGRSDVQRKKRKLTEDGLGQDSKLVKRLEHPQENQLPCASSECGESVSAPSCAQWNDSFQSEHLEGNLAAEAPVNCSESKETLSHSSELGEHQEVRIGKGKYHCTYCHLKCRDAERLKRHLFVDHKNLLQCPDCMKCFKNIDSMSEHRLTSHNVEKPYQCTECNLTFNSVFDRNQHRHTVHATEEGFKCPECKQCFPSKGNLRKHHSMSHFRCTECNFSFNSALGLYNHHHMAVGTEESFKCPECKKHFITADGMSHHLLMSHNVEKPFQCTECNLTFNSLFFRNQHGHTAHGTEEGVKCPECKKHFLGECSLRKHCHTVHFQCSECNLTFDSALKLHGHDHEAVGTEERLKCPECKKYFKGKCRLRKHCHIVHYQCRECNLIFDSALELYNHDHMAVGTEESFKCTECKKHFPGKCGLRKHCRIVHFQCAQCNLTFNSALELYKHDHMAVGTQESFKCPDCNTQFVNAEIMKQHRLIIHNVKEIFSCPDCRKEFISLDSLTEHQIGCTGGQPVQCTECHMILENESRLSQHQFEVHNMKTEFICTDYTEAFSVDEAFDWL